MSRPNVRRGLSVPFPGTVATELERRYGRLNRRALQLARSELIPAIESGVDAEVAAALQRIENALGDEFGPDQLEPDAARAAAAVNGAHRRQFFGALGAAIGARIVGTDDPGAGSGVLSTAPVDPVGGSQGSGAGIVPPLAPVPSRARVRGRGVLAVRVNAEPSILADEFAASNAQLISSLTADIVPGLRDEVVREVVLGSSDADKAAARLLAKWQKQGVPVLQDFGEVRMTGAGGSVHRLNNRVRFIVHDQISKLNAQITQARQVAAGIEKFTWVTMGDSRVRPLHRQINGNVYAWAEGHPTEGLPGTPPNCRCHAAAVVSRDQVLKNGGFVLIGESEIEFAV